MGYESKSPRTTKQIPRSNFMLSNLQDTQGGKIQSFGFFAGFTQQQGSQRDEFVHFFHHNTSFADAECSFWVNSKFSSFYRLAPSFIVNFLIDGVQTKPVCTILIKVSQPSQFAARLSVQNVIATGGELVRSFSGRHPHDGLYVDRALNKLKRVCCSPLRKPQACSWAGC